LSANNLCMMGERYICCNNWCMLLELEIMEHDLCVCTLQFGDKGSVWRWWELDHPSIWADGAL